MKKGVYLVLDDDRFIELMRILIDGDDEASLNFVKANFMGKAHELLEGG